MIKKKAEWLGEKTSKTICRSLRCGITRTTFMYFKKMKIVCLSKFFVKGFVPAKA
jgi:hypothetical protein